MVAAATDPPIPPGALERARLRMSRSIPMRGVGAHLRRLAGHSLEFREFRDYRMGDDIRLVDWRASARRGDISDRIVRVFEAERRMILAILVDARPAMRLPEGAEKLLCALWISRALAEVAGAHGDEVILATMFSERNGRIVATRGRAASAAARRFAEDIWANRGESLREVPVARLGALRRRLVPASAVVVLSDLLFDDAAGSVGGFMRDAQRSWRQVIVQRLDSVDHELSLARKAGRIRAVDIEGRSFGEAVYDTDDGFAAEARCRASAHARRLIDAWKGPGLTVAPPLIWPKASGPDALRRRFAESFLRGGVLGAVASRGGAR